MRRTRRERDDGRNGGPRGGGARPRALLALALTAVLAACGGPPGEGDLTPQATLVAEPGSVRVAVDGRCSLGEAILAAERDASVNECPAGSPGPDTIALRSGGLYLADTVYDAPEPPASRDAALPPIGSEITVLGNGAELVRPEWALTGSGNLGVGFLEVLASGRLTVRDLTFRRGVGRAPLINHGRMELLGVDIVDSGRNSTGFSITVYAAVESLGSGSLLLEDCVISGARDISYGIVASEGDLTMRDCVVEDNHFSDGSGSLSHIAPVIRGEPVVLERVLIRDNIGFRPGVQATGNLTIRDSTVVVDTQFEGGSGLFLFNGALLMEQSTLQITSPYGRAIEFSNRYRETGGSTVIRNSTIVGAGDVLGDRMDWGIAGRHITGIWEVTLDHTVIAGFDVACEPYSSEGFSTHSLIFSSAGWNLIDDRTCDLRGPGDLQGVDPLLAPLADNGGPTPTMELRKYSPAIDAGDPAFTGPPNVDQRGEGFPRVVGSAVDIGAFETGVYVVERPTYCSESEVPIGGAGRIVGCVDEPLVECLLVSCGEVPLVMELFPDAPCRWCLVQVDLRAGWNGPVRVTASLPLAREDLLGSAGVWLLDATGKVVAEAKMRDGIKGDVPHLVVSGEVLKPGIYWLALEGAVKGADGFVVREALRLSMDPL